MGYREVGYLIAIFLVQTGLILIFLPVIYSVFRITLIEYRFLDQLIKLIIFLLMAFTWLYIFKSLYYWSYRRLSSCGG